MNQQECSLLPSTTNTLTACHREFPQLTARAASELHGIQLILRNDTSDVHDITLLTTSLRALRKYFLEQIRNATSKGNGRLDAATIEIFMHAFSRSQPGQKLHDAYDIILLAERFISLIDSLATKMKVNVSEIVWWRDYCSELTTSARLKLSWHEVL